MTALTVLGGPKVRAAKGQGKRYLGFLLAHESMAIDGIVSLVEALETLSTMRNAYVIRGGIRPESPPLIRRRYRHEPFHVIEVSQQWLCVDIDGRASAIDVYAEPERAVAAARAQLPDGLSSALCYYAITGSASQHEIHCHLWYWLDRPYGNNELKRALEGHCDISLYRPTQPHFTALPIIPDDPLEGRRRGILEGDQPAYVGSAPMRADPERAERELLAAMTAIAEAKKKGVTRHSVINRKAYHLAYHCATGALPRDRVIAALTSAAKAAGLSDERAADEVKRGVADGMRDAPNREQWVERLQRTESGVPKPSYFNMAVALSESPDWVGAIGWNQRQNCVDWLRDPPLNGFKSARNGLPFREEHSLIPAEWLGKYGISTARDTIINVIKDVSHKVSFDPVSECLDEMDWDGTPRLSEMLCTYFGVERGKQSWARAVGRAWMISAVARAYDPGCKADNILVLEGPQGRFKSTALDVLGLGYTREIRVSLDNKDAADALHTGCWIAVLTELDAFKSTRRSESVKAYLSALEDHFRRAYGHFTQTHKRSIVFAATTNEESYLLDPTGNRRFWPVWCETIDIEALRRDVEQLWAEARHAYLNGEAWWIAEEHVNLAAAEQAQRLIPDSWEEYIEKYVSKNEFFTLTDLLENALALEPVQQTDRAISRVERYLRRLGYGIVIREAETDGQRRRKGYAKVR